MATNYDNSPLSLPAVIALARARAPLLPPPKDRSSIHSVSQSAALVVGIHSFVRSLYCYFSRELYCTELNSTGRRCFWYIFAVVLLPLRPSSVVVRLCRKAQHSKRPALPSCCWLEPLNANYQIVDLLKISLHCYASVVCVCVLAAKATAVAMTAGFSAAA